jgi:hypothetical protein
VLHLIRAYHYYRRGYEQGIAGDFGYNAINTAFLLDLLASQESEEVRKAGGEPDAVEARRTEARRIRKEIIEELPLLGERPEGEWLKHKWWYYSTVGEAYFGLQDYERAAEWLKRDGLQDLEGSRVGV